MADGSEKKTRLGTGGLPVVGAPTSTPAPVTPVPHQATTYGHATPAPRTGSTPVPQGVTSPDSVAPTRAELGTNVPAAGMATHVPPPDRLVGTTLLDRYYVEKKLGEGGMGAVYLAHHTTLEKKLALKVLHAEFSRKPDLVERFLLEAKAASRIRHENVIDISDFGTTPEGSVFFAMEFLEGKDLHEVLARAKLQGQRVPWERTRPIFLQVCAALAAAHEKGIVHRDLKPENIYLVEWLGHKDFVKLLDFGIAKVTEVSDDDEEARKLTRTGMLFGTPEYMSPEQARGDKVDHRSDVYAMGCILFQMVTGAVPFETDNFMGILSLHLTEPVPEVSPEALAAIGAPPALVSVIERALVKDRDQRFQSVTELADAVRAADQGVAVESPPVVAESAGSHLSPHLASRARGADGGHGPLGPHKRTQWTGSIRLDEDTPTPEPTGGKKAGWLIGGLVGAVAIGAVVFLLVRGGGEGAAPAPAEPTGPAEVEAPLPATINLVLESQPVGATVIDQKTGESLGTTPFEFSMPGSLEPRRIRFTLAGYQDKLIEFVPSDDIRYTIELKKLAAGAAQSEPVVEKVPTRHRPRPRPDASKPDTTKPDTTKPDVTKPDTAKPDTAKPDTAKPDTAKPDTAKPDTTKPDTAKPDTTKPDTTKPDTAKPDTTKPDTTKPDTTKPDTTKPDDGKIEDPKIKDPFAT